MSYCPLPNYSPTFQPYVPPVVSFVAPTPISPMQAPPEIAYGYPSHSFVGDINNKFGQPTNHRVLGDGTLVNSLFNTQCENLKVDLRNGSILDDTFGTGFNTGLKLNDFNQISDSKW